jgi:hypothetical protein
MRFEYEHVMAYLTDCYTIRGVEFVPPQYTFISVARIEASSKQTQRCF